MSDAITPEAPTAVARAHKLKGMLYIDWDLCKGCGFCVDFCPTKVLALSEEFNAHGYHPPYQLPEKTCTGCDLCGLYCPDFAIFSVRVPVDNEPNEGGKQ